MCIEFIRPFNLVKSECNCEIVHHANYFSTIIVIFLNAFVTKLIISWIFIVTKIFKFMDLQFYVIFVNKIYLYSMDYKWSEATRDEYMKRKINF